MNTVKYLTTAIFTIAISAPFVATAVPINLVANGTVTDANGTLAGGLGTAFSTNITFDLDEANAFAVESIAPVGDLAFTRWTYVGEPYGSTFSGDFGVLTDSVVRVETIDNFDADANGNPFGITGIVDIFSIFGGSFIVDCTNGTVQPITGCDDPNAPFLSGIEFGINLVLAGDSFGTSELPTSLPSFANLIGVAGNGEELGGGATVGDLAVSFSSLSITTPTVPVPAAAWLFGSGLIGLVGVARRKKS